MNLKQRAITLSYAFIGCIMLTTAHAGDWHNKKVTIYSDPIAGGVQVMTDHGFMEPIPGITNEDAMLFNIPADGTEPVPLRQVPTLYLTEGLNPVVIDESISADNKMRGLAFPGTPNPITFGDWNDIGHSKFTVKILNNGMSKTKMRVKGLLPNSLYTVWQFNVMPGPPGPFGGIPNVLATDHKGNATLKRILPFNVLDTIDNLVLIYHSDHSVYGGTPSRINIFAGHDQHVQLQFNIQAAQ